MTPGTGVIGRLQRPEYTGENRCTPCTVVNVAVAVILAAAVWLAVPSTAGPILGAVVLVTSLCAIYLRGYLVPGTPWFTRTYFPDWLLRRFEKGPASGQLAGPHQPDGDAPGRIDVESALLRADVLTECDDVDDLCLTPAFQAAFRERIAALRREDTTRDELATILDVDAPRLTFDDHGTAFVASVSGRRIGQWESRAAFRADVAAAKVLDERAEEWQRLDVDARGRLLTGIRLFVETCPDCDGAVTVEEDVVESCCRSIDVAAASCVDCGARLFETELPASA